MAVQDVPGQLGTLLQQHRVAAGLSQEELAERAGLSRRGISDLERGARRAPHPATLRRLADALELDQAERTALLASARTADARVHLATGPEPAPSFADLLRRARMGARLSQAALAQKTGLSERAISDLERGVRRFPYSDTVTRLIQALDLGERECSLFESGALRLNAVVDEPAGAGIAANNLPVQLTSFIGRVQDTAAIRAELTRTRLLTLAGPGGVGKTRLALRVAEEELGNFRDGVWFVELAPLTEPTLVPEMVANLFNIRESPDQPLITGLSNILRSRQMLLILDNCEHVLPVCVDLVYRLLRACPLLVVLATSRQVLGLASETIWRVPPLQITDANAMPALLEVALIEAPALFLERARAVQPGFVVTPQNAAALLEICRRVEGIPLAIELAASRIGVLGLEQISERLGSHFRLLASRDPTIESRQQTLDKTIRWSYELLTPEERTLFDRLSVFAAGCSLDAIEAIAGDETLGNDNLLDLLHRLIDKSLVNMERMLDGRARYRMLEPLRQFGRDRLDERRELRTTQHRHAAFFIELFEHAELELDRKGGPDRAWLARIDPEGDNLRAALRFLIEQWEVNNAQRLAGAARPFWFTHGYLAEGRRWLEEVLAMAPASDVPDAQLAKVLRAIGHLALYQGDLATTEAVATRSLELYRRLGDMLHHAVCVWQLAGVAEGRANFPEAQALYEEALALTLTAGSTSMISNPLYSLALIASEEGRIAESQQLAEESLRWAKATGLSVLICNALSILGDLQYRRGDAETARSLWEEGLAGVRETHARTHFMITPLVQLGRLEWEHGNLTQARALLAEALALGHQASRYHLAHVLEAIGEIVAGEAQPEAAVQLIGAAAAMRDAMGTPLWPTERARLDPAVGRARRLLGEASADAAWMRGWTEPVDHTVVRAQHLLKE
jgi:non-specific serine/threonine protein kinase